MGHQRTYHLLSDTMQQHSMSESMSIWLHAGGEGLESMPVGSRNQRPQMSAGTCSRRKAPRRGQGSVARSEPEPGWRGNTPAGPGASTVFKTLSLSKKKYPLCALKTVVLCRCGNLSIISERPLEKSLLDHASPHFRLQHPLRPAPALVCICGMEDEKYQQIYHLEPQNTFDSLIPISCNTARCTAEAHLMVSDFIHRLNRLRKKNKMEFNKQK